MLLPAFQRLPASRMGEDEVHLRHQNQWLFEFPRSGEWPSSVRMMSSL
jgi:hypothetical protein